MYTIELPKPDGGVSLLHYPSFKQAMAEWDKQCDYVLADTTVRLYKDDKVISEYTPRGTR